MTDADKIQKLKAHETDLLEQRFKLETRQEEIESALSLLNARLEEVRRALELFDDIDRARAATAKAKATKPEPEKPPREIAANEIDDYYSSRDLPTSIDALPGAFANRHNPRTLRAALNLVAERRQKAGADRAQVPADPPPSAAPVGSEPEIEHPERPDFLTRARENAA